MSDNMKYGLSIEQEMEEGRSFLAQNNFVINESREKFMFTFNPRSSL